MSEPYALWFILGVALSIMEIFTAGFFIIWFGIAAIITAAVAYFFHNILLELGIFTFASMVLLALTKPLYSKMNEGPKVPSNVNALIGKNGIVIAEIDNNQGSGLIKIGGETWSARAQNNVRIGLHEQVKVISVEGAKLIVTPEK